MPVVMALQSVLVSEALATHLALKQNVSMIIRAES